MQIRAETTADYAQIDNVHINAFGGRTYEALVVVLCRQRAEFDPALSLVAEIDGHIAGHALFSPYHVQLNGQMLRAVNLAPIGVDPTYQKQGIGRQLIEAGHALARQQGYAFSFLLGHTSYYPRFGYQTAAFGEARLKLPLANFRALKPALTARPLLQKDLRALQLLWQITEMGVDFSLDPGNNLLDWLSPNPAIESRVYTDEAGQLVGYSRVHKAEPLRPRVLLAADGRTARQMITLLAQATETAATEIDLPLHPASPVATGLAEAGEIECQPWEAAMVCPLNPSPFEDYYARLQSKTIQPGRVIWPTAFDLE